MSDDSKKRPPGWTEAMVKLWFEENPGKSLLWDDNFKTQLKPGKARQALMDAKQAASPASPPEGRVMISTNNFTFLTTDEKKVWDKMVQAYIDVQQIIVLEDGDELNDRLIKLFEDYVPILEREFPEAFSDWCRVKIIRNTGEKK